MKLEARVTQAERDLANTRVNAPFNLRDLCDGVAALFERDLREKGVAWSCELAVPTTQLVGDVDHDARVTLEAHRSSMGRAQPLVDVRVRHPLAEEHPRRSGADQRDNHNCCQYHQPAVPQDQFARGIRCGARGRP